MFVCMHEITSSGFSFRTAMESYAKAGIKAVEPDLVKVREFEQLNGDGSAKAFLIDLDLRAVSSSNQLFLEESGPRQGNAFEQLKWKVELAESIGANRLVIPSAASAPHNANDYPKVYESLIRAAEIARPCNVSLMLEFTRNSTLIANLRTAIKIVREIDHPNLKLMLDLYHFWAGTSKFEDLDELEQNELHHLHIADVPVQPTVEVFQQKDRAFPGEGISPLQKIIDKVRSKGYDGAASLELFDPEVQNTNPYLVAEKAIKVVSPFLS